LKHVLEEEESGPAGDGGILFKKPTAAKRAKA